MESRLYILCISLLTQFCVAANITNPVSDYAAFHALAVDRVILKWVIDINGDTKSEILLDTKLTPDEQKQEDADAKNYYDPNIKGFSVYIANADGVGYVESKGEDDGDGVGLGTTPEIDITQCYAGYIDEINGSGIVTVITDNPRRTAAISRIYAYSIDGDHIKRTKLAEYDPDQSNAIYDKYLTASKRTQVHLQEVHP